MPCRRHAAGFSLIELLIVVALVGILAALILPNSQPTTIEQLRSTARIMAADLALARSLAVANNRKYRITFQFDQNRYVMEHSGTNSALNQLPRSPFASAGDPADKYIVDLDELPRVGPLVQLWAVGAGDPMQTVSDIEFGPLGETTRAETTTIWLTVGGGDSARYVGLEINPVTGLAFVGEITAAAPTGISAPQMQTAAASPASQGLETAASKSAAAAAGATKAAIK